MLVAVSATAQTPAGLVAHYAFDDGAGDILHDRSGHGYDGTITAAQWTTQDRMPSLHFRGHGDYVDFGDNRNLKLAGDMTILAWVHLDASPHPDEATNWTIVDCEVYRQEGFLLRIDGGSSRTLFRSNQSGAEQSGFGSSVIDNHGVHLVGLVRQGNTATLYLNGVPDAEFAVQPSRIDTAPFRISSPAQSFAGDLMDIAIFDRALTGGEIAAHYWQGAEHYGRNAAQHGQLVLTPRIYYTESEARADIDFLGVMPMEEGERLCVELAQQSGDVLAMQESADIPKEGRGEYVFPLNGLADGTYELRATLKGGARNAQAAVAFDWPAKPVAVPAPDAMSVAPIPQTPPPPALQLNVTKGGGATLTVDNHAFPIESSFTYPNGACNRLVCADTTDATGESEWTVASRQADGVWYVEARGKFYALTRRMAAGTGRIAITDTLTNITTEPLGVILHNQVGPGDSGMTHAVIGGKETTLAVANRDLKTCPTLLLTQPGLGIGLAALDDVYIVQARGAFDPQQGIDLYSNEFALDAGASYTLEWAIYANATGDFYDMINALRRDENRNTVTVQGGLTMVPGAQQKRRASLVPKAPFFDIRNLAYLTVPCLSWCTDDPEISVEGIEFIEHPLERQRVREMMDAIHATRPGVKGMFHVAHQLFATNRPDDHFPDSRVLDETGKQTVYPNDYANGGYFSKQRAADNWRWWIYYPTLENTFGKALLDSVDVMMDEMGTRGVFADGFLWGYGGLYTYDCWDGHSADIAPDTHVIQRKKASTLLVTQDAMLAWCRKIWGKGGVVIANGVVPTRTLCSQPLIMDKEVTEGPDVTLLTTPVTLGNPGACRTDREVYQDVLNKLRWGNLYFYYGEPSGLAYESLPAKMYPITVQELHSGYIKGNERLITMHSGVYGWPESRDLHLAYRFDSRGHPVPAPFITTVDTDSVRTMVELGDKETAVLVRIPVKIDARFPVNVHVESFDGNALTMNVHAQGEARVTLPDEKPHTVDFKGQTVIHLTQ